MEQLKSAIINRMLSEGLKVPPGPFTIDVKLADSQVNGPNISQTFTVLIAFNGEPK